VGDRIFLDTNVLIYAVDSTDSRKHRIAAELLAAIRSDREGWVSYQVVQEWLNFVLRKAAGKLGVDASTDLYQQLVEPLGRVESSRDLTAMALSIHGRERLSWWDSLIVAAAVLGRCDSLLTEDLQHGQVIRGVRIENPFL
jgi:predicted nucleic acid-binding protein